ncbi:MAG TPA: chemotaxis protein CheA [Thermoanaerobaculia bacterium]|nr:chemotaxis protein CheA [Thermoanaerobaculia bacterium]
MADTDLNLDFDRDDLLATFADEATEEIAALESGLLALETTPLDAELRRDLLRYAHTLKGNASCVGLTTLTAFAHAYEDMLERIDGTDLEVDRAMVTLLLGGIDTLKRQLAGGLAPIASAANGQAPTAHRRSLRVSADRLNRMLNLSGEISIARGRVQQLLVLGNTDDLIETERELDFLHGELQELIMRARMVPVGPLFRQYARTVRDLASGHGKNARLITIGDDVEIDTTAVEMLRDPLTHMIRNAIDHGLEPSAERTLAGKAPAGTITLEARHEAGHVIICVSDDGAGLDRDAIAARAQRLGLEANDQVIFESGFSTTDEVTDLSGRGVGMDVVRRGIESLRGTIRIDSKPGLGTTFTIRLPLTLAVIDGFAVSAAGETWIVPMANVLECVELPAPGHPERSRGTCADGRDDQRTTAPPGTGVLLLRDEIVPYVRLRSLFAIEGDAPARENVLVVQHDGMKGGLVIDELHGASQAVIKPLGDYFAEVPGIAGSSILGSGRVALILDVRAIFDRAVVKAASVEQTV